MNHKKLFIIIKIYLLIQKKMKIITSGKNYFKKLILKKILIKVIVIEMLMEIKIKSINFYYLDVGIKCIKNVVLLKII